MESIYDIIRMDKYEALAFSSPKGVALSELVEASWIDWVDTVSYAPWLRNWKKSNLYNKKGFTPAGNSYTEHGICSYGLRDVKYVGAIASALYASIVWGLGVEQWLTPKHYDAKGQQARSAVLHIYKLQGISKPSAPRLYTWDLQVYKRCGLCIPVELSALDKWLEPLWHQLK